MMTKTRAIVLNSMKFGDTQLIVDLFTEQQGRVSFICRIPKTSKGKIKKQYFQNLSVLNVEYDFRQNAKLQRLRDVHIAEPFVTLHFDSFKIAISFFVAEFLCYSTRNEQQNTSLYQYIENSILWLDKAEIGYSSFHLVFMMKLTRFLGFFPNIEEFHKGDFFDLRESRFVSFLPSHSDFVSPEDASMIKQLFRLSYETMNLWTLSHFERNKCAEVLMCYYRLHIPNFPEMKSMEVLKELF